MCDAFILIANEPRMLPASINIVAPHHLELVHLRLHYITDNCGNWGRARKVGA